MPGIILKSLALAAVACSVGFIFNLARPEGLPLVAKEPYEIFVPCPITTKEAGPARLDDLCEDLSCLFVVDARPETEYRQAHIPNAVSIPYDPIRQLDEEALTELRQVKAAGILVYGDLEINSGKLLADELASAGLRGVRYLQGGFPAWLEAGRGTRGGNTP